MDTRERLNKFKECGFRLIILARATGISEPMITAYARGTRTCCENSRLKIEEAMDKILEDLKVKE